MKSYVDTEFTSKTGRTETISNEKWLPTPCDFGGEEKKGESRLMSWYLALLALWKMKKSQMEGGLMRWG